MASMSNPRRALALLLALLGGAPVEGVPMVYRFDGGADAGGSELHVRVPTSLHTFEVAAGSLRAKAHLDPEAPADAAAWLDIPVRGLTTGNVTRDTHLRELVLAAGSHPTLRYRARGFSGPVQGSEVDGWRGTLRGVLELAGLRRPAPVPVEIRRLSDGRLHVSGRVGLDIRRFGLRPPDKVVVRVEPEVEVRFELRLAPGGTVPVDVDAR